jgi:YbbR domain-containing protein
MTLNTNNTFLAAGGNMVTLEEIVFPTSLLLNIDFRMERSLQVVPDIVATPDEGYAVRTISEPVPSEVTVIGPRSVVKSLSRVDTERKELTGLRNNIDLTLPILVPPGQDITIEPDSVRVLLEIVPVKTRVFDGIPVMVYNAPPGREVLINPATIRVELTGPPAEIDLLNRNALIASVDYRLLDSKFTAAIKIDCPSHFQVKEISADSATLSVQ